MRVAAALLGLYLIWGSTYLAIRIALESLPPFAAAGSRFLVAGTLLYAIAWARGAALARPRDWLAGVALGGLFFLGGNGGVVWAQTRVPSGVAALLIAMVPMWIAVLEALSGRVVVPWTRWIGLGVGLGGIALLVGPDLGDGGGVDPLGALGLTGAALSWAIGTLASRRWPQPSSPIAASGVQMLGGGVLLLAVGALAGESVDLAAVTTRSWLGFAWLLVGGSLVGFTLYRWLLEVSTPAVASTYAFVNPVVAVFLGWFAADEVVGPRVGLASVLVVGAVALITWSRRAADPGAGEAGRGDDAVAEVEGGRAA